MMRIYFLAGIVFVSVALLTYYKDRQYKHTAPARKRPRGKRNQDINRGRLGDASDYDRVSSVTIL